MEEESMSTPVSFADRFTGCLLGMAIGDALGTPRAFSSNVPANHPLEYLPRLLDDSSIEVPAGQFSLNTELALCLLETLATSDGFVDPGLAIYRFENAATRSSYLGETRETRAIAYAASSEAFQSGGDSPSTRYAGPAARVTPLALVHSLSDLNVALITREVMRSVLLTDANPVVVNGALAVAYAVRLLMRQEIPLALLIEEVLSLVDEDDVARALRAGGTVDATASVTSVVPRALHAVVMGDGDLERSLSIAFAAGGATHLTGAIVGALCGCHVGASNLNQALIDGLEGRAYVLMASPALLRTSQLRAGLLFQLRLQ
jgi:ADP-ribosylglycohydrolase